MHGMQRRRPVSISSKKPKWNNLRQEEPLSHRTEIARWSHKVNPLLKAKLHAHIAEALERVDPSRYRQEPAYMNAVIARLDGEVDAGSAGSITIRGVIVDDRGPGSAESVHGADFSITAILCTDKGTTEKAILGQAKRGPTEALNKSEKARLDLQLTKMQRVTRNFVIAEIPLVAGQSLNVRESRRIAQPRLRPAVTFTDYLVDRLLACHHGDIRRKFIGGVGTSQLSGLEITYRDAQRFS